MPPKKTSTRSSKFNLDSNIKTLKMCFKCEEPCRKDDEVECIEEQSLACDSCKKWFIKMFRATLASCINVKTVYQIKPNSSN